MKIEGKEYRTIWFENNVVKIIDQTKLPHQFIIKDLKTVKDAINAIKIMEVRGAPLIGGTAAYGMALAIQENNDPEFIKKSAEELIQSRPTAINLKWAVDRMMKKLSGINSDQILNTALEEAKEICDEDEKFCKNIGLNGLKIIEEIYNKKKNTVNILTHCNAGALATAGHGTALGVIRSAVEQGKKISVIADETRPFLQGARLTSWELIQDNIPVTLITDNMSGYLMSKGEINAIIVGTDRVAANGDVANKIGTYMVAVLAKRHNIPFYVACPISTIDLNCPNGEAIPIEERAKEEVTGYRDTQWAAKGVNVRNPSFDVTPAELVTAIITEKGIIHRPNIKNVGLIFN